MLGTFGNDVLCLAQRSLHRARNILDPFPLLKVYTLTGSCGFAWIISGLLSSKMNRGGLGESREVTCLGSR